MKAQLNISTRISFLSKMFVLMRRVGEKISHQANEKDNTQCFLSDWSLTYKCCWEMKHSKTSQTTRDINIMMDRPHFSVLSRALQSLLISLCFQLQLFRQLGHNTHSQYHHFSVSQPSLLLVPLCKVLNNFAVLLS